FYRFTPLVSTRPALASEIEKVTARGGLDIPRDRIFEMNASKKLKSINAYVTGIGASKRVVVWDTTLKTMTTAQTLFIFGHEMGLADPSPSPFIEFWLYSHPSVSERVRFASEYDPWARGETPKYVK